MIPLLTWLEAYAVDRGNQQLGPAWAKRPLPAPLTRTRWHSPAWWGCSKHIKAKTWPKRTEGTKLLAPRHTPRQPGHPLVGAAWLRCFCSALCASCTCCVNTIDRGKKYEMLLSLDISGDCRVGCFGWALHRSGGLWNALGCDVVGTGGSVHQFGGVLWDACIRVSRTPYRHYQMHFILMTTLTFAPWTYTDVLCASHCFLPMSSKIAMTCILLHSHKHYREVLLHESHVHSKMLSVFLGRCTSLMSKHEALHRDQSPWISAQKL